MAIGVFGCFLLQGCGRSMSEDNPYVGNMSDTSYSAQWTKKGGVYRVNALGHEVCVAVFKGKFVWADYAAPWCDPCILQAPVIRALERGLGDQIVFLTVITSETSEFRSIPTQKTARDWAQKFGLNPARVVIATDAWGMTIPTHILFSPTGQTLYRAKGFHSEDQIRTIMAGYIQDWRAWSEKGIVADWMTQGS